MKKLLAILFCFGVACLMTAGVTGCKKDEVKPTDKAKQTVAAAKKTITVKDADATVKQGEEAKVAITLDRGAEVKAAFKAEVKSEEKGITASGGDVEKEKDKGEVVVKVAADVKPGEYKVTVGGSSEGATVVAGTIKVKVEEKKKEVVVPPPKKDMSLKATGDKVTVKQGEKGKVSVKIEKGADVKDVTVKTADGKGPKDAKGKVTSTVKGSDVEVTVSDDATEGEWTIAVTASAEGATDATATITVTVEKKKKG